MQCESEIRKLTLSVYLYAVGREVTGRDAHKLSPCSTAILERYKIRLLVVKKTPIESPKVRIDLIRLEMGKAKT